MGIIGNFATRSEHVPEIERQIRVLKERARACRHTLPFKYLPRLIVIEMMNNCALWLNVFPPKGGVSTISPRTLITGVKFDYTKHCKLPFGAYAQVHEEPSPSNSQVARTVGAICLAQLETNKAATSLLTSAMGNGLHDSSGHHYQCHMTSFPVSTRLVIPKANLHF